MTTKTSDDYLNNLRIQLNKGINLIDYFLVIGPKPEIFINDWLYDNDLNDLINEYLPKLSPELLSQFPPIEKTITGLDETIIQHCFPKGYTLESFQKAPELEIFSIILDNNLFSIDYPYKYVTCLKFYEGISSYRKLYDRYSQLINKQKNYTMNKLEIPSISRDYFSISDTTTTISNNTSRVSTRVTFGGLKRVKYRTLYLAKCICLVSLYPLFNEYAKILKAFYQYSCNVKVKIPIEKFIQNLVIEVPVPPRGLLSVEYPLFNEVITLKQSCINELPSLSIEFEKLFVEFTLNQILVIFKHVLLESRIVFFSSNISLLTPIIFSSLALIYPFEYPFNIASILPKEAYHLIENVTSVIVGVNEQYTPSFFSDYDIDISDITILIVDIDNKALELKKQKAKRETEIPDLPKQLKEKLEWKINTYIQHIKTKKEPREVFSSTIRTFFLKFFLKLLKHYNKYLNADIYNHNNKKSLIHNAFKVNEFIQTIDHCDKPFYNKLILETQLFVDFIYKRMTPKSKKEILQILFFEEKMFEKYSNKKSSVKGMNNKLVFISSNDYAIKNSYSVDKVKNMTQLEKKYYYNQDNHINCLYNGLIVDMQDECNKDHHHGHTFNHQDYSFTTPIFPRLQSDFFFKTAIEQKSYFIPQNLFDSLDPINSDLIGKSHLNTVEIKDCEMDNYIYLCWIKLWALSFWYHDKQERNCRFQQLLEVLDKVIYHEMDIFNLLFQVLVSDQSEEDMIITLYQKLIFYRLNPSSYVFDMVSKLIEKREKRGIISHNSIIKYINNFKYESKEIQRAFRRRTFKNKNDTRIIKEQIKIYGNEECFSCKTTITLHSIMENINRAKKQNLWVECPKCHNDFIPALTIRFGAEFNPKGDLKVNTSLFDDFAFYSPFTLYYNLIPSLTNDYKLDIDNFKSNFLPIFWNCVYYFKVKGINYDFFLPYEDSATKKNIDITMNKNTGFEISYNALALRDSFQPLQSSQTVQISESILCKNRGGRFNSNTSFILRKEIEIEYCSILNGISADDDTYQMESTPRSTYENVIIGTEESMINGGNFVDNSSVYFDTQSRYTDTDMGDEVYISKSKSRTYGLYQLMEIKEDQNENVLTQSQKNTPNKQNNHQLLNSVDACSPSLKHNSQLTFKNSDMQWEKNSNFKKSNALQKSSTSLSFGDISSPDCERNKASCRNEKEIITFTNEMLISMTSKNTPSVHLLNNVNNVNDDDDDDPIGRTKTPTKIDFSINAEVVKEFREKYSSKSEKSNCCEPDEQPNAIKIINNILCRSSDDFKNKENYI